MGTQMIEYSFSGDEAAWRATIDTFFAHVRADPVLCDGLVYTVFVRADGVSRVHVPVWRDQAVLDHMFKQRFFEVFSAAVKEFAEGKLTVTKPLVSA